MNLSTVLVSLASTLIAAATIGCASAPPQLTPFPAGRAILLLDGPVHLGDNRAGGQSFTNGDAAAARVCSLVNMPRPTMAYVQVQNVRQTESLGDLLTVNGKPIRLPITLERDPRGVSSNATSASPVELVSLAAGPSEICLVAGQRPCGDLDDFEVDQVVLFVQGIDEGEVSVRRNLMMGRPAPTAPPSVPWGRDQSPFAQTAATAGHGGYCGEE
jgi:hypothetical protein